MSPNITVFRAIKKSTWWKPDGEPHVDIFLRLIKEDELSILTQSNCEKTGICEAGLRSCHGEVGLKAESFINLGFYVIQTPIEQNVDKPAIPYHASVYGMPPENEADARNIAFELVQQIIYKQQRKYKRK